MTAVGTDNQYGVGQSKCTGLVTCLSDLVAVGSGLSTRHLRDHYSGVRDHKCTWLETVFYFPDRGAGTHRRVYLSGLPVDVPILLAFKR